MRGKGLLAVAALAAAAFAAVPLAVADTAKPADGWWPVHAKRTWHYEGDLVAGGAPKPVAYATRASGKKVKVGEREAYPLETLSGTRVIATEWFDFDGAKVLLVAQKTGDEAQRVVSPPQVFLDTAELVPDGKWSYASADKSETVECKLLKNDEKVTTKSGTYSCAVVETHLVVKGAGDATPAHEQRRKLWIAKDTGLVREVSTTQSGGEASTTLKVDLVKVETPE